MAKILWYSRHPMTAPQAAELAGFEVVSASSLAGRSVDMGNVYDHVDELLAICKQERIRRIYGVFSTAVLSISYRTMAGCVASGDFPNGGVTLYAAVNVQRSDLEGARTFEHGGFVAVGLLV